MATKVGKTARKYIPAKKYPDAIHEPEDDLLFEIFNSQSGVIGELLNFGAAAYNQL